MALGVFITRCCESLVISHAELVEPNQKNCAKYGKIIEFRGKSKNYSGLEKLQGPCYLDRPSSVGKILIGPSLLFPFFYSPYFFNYLSTSIHLVHAGSVYNYG